MSPNRLIFDPPAKLKYYKNDLGPIGFYFDIFTTEIFKIPVMPVPMRIDILTNGGSTFFIFPDTNKLNQALRKLDLVMNFKNFYLLGIENLINFTKRKYKEITCRTLKKEMIVDWFENSLAIKTEIPSLTEDFTFLILEFLKMFSNIENKGLDPNQKGFDADFLRYCESIINYFKKKIENNSIQIKSDGIIKTEKLYLEKKKKYYPQLISINATNMKRNNLIKRYFIPYLIYDDIIDIFAYNQKLLRDRIQYPVDLTIWKYNRIINKRSNLVHIDAGDQITNFELQETDLSKIL